MVESQNGLSVLQRPKQHAIVYRYSVRYNILRTSYGKGMLRTPYHIDHNTTIDSICRTLTFSESQELDTSYFVCDINTPFTINKVELTPQKLPLYDMICMTDNLWL